MLSVKKIPNIRSGQLVHAALHCPFLTTDLRLPYQEQLLDALLTLGAGVNQIRSGKI